jgi:hypothetical protein
MLEVRRDRFAGALCGSRRRDGEAGSDDDSFDIHGGCSPLPGCPNVSPHQILSVTWLGGASS